MFDRRTLHAREAVEILEESFGDPVFKTRIKKTIRYAEAPVKETSVLKYDPEGQRREGLPRPGEGGSQQLASAPACVKALAGCSSGRRRPRSASRSPPSRPSPSRRRRPRPRRRRRPEAAPVEPLEETVEHAPPFEPIEGEPEPEPEPAPRPDLRPVGRACCASRRCPSPRSAPSSAARRARRLPRGHPRGRCRRRGSNAVNRMIDAGLADVEFVAVNTDIQQLALSDAPVKIHHREPTQGLGSGASADLGPPGRRGVLRPDQACPAGNRTWSS